ncbi:MAG: hypothetical protein DRQ43_04520 [Gammaproteobacteria bacterium]|nr:MAG: hypothetical protein DRQ43_04520 [Gammaproteobacteria bacterium]
MKQNNLIHLLLVNPSKNDAVELSNLLRNNNLTLDSKIVSNAALFDDAINKKTYDIILFKNDIANLDISSALKKLNSRQKNHTITILLGNKTAKETLKLFNQGINAVINEDSIELIVPTIKKEFAALKAFRSEDILKQKLNDSEHRCHQLIDSSHDAIAYIHEGMHIFSNEPYCKMFGYNSREDIEVMPIMDLVSSDDAAELKKSLRYYSESNKLSTDNTKKESSLNVKGIKEDSTEFQINMEFQFASMSGEDCIQIIIRNNEISLKAQKKLEKQLTLLNTHCQETGLYNRHYFLTLLDKAVEDAVDNNNNSYLLFISLNNFINIRESLGDIKSDKLIIDIANLIKNITNEGSSLARFESNQFSAIINTDDEKQILQIAKEILEAVNTHIIDISEGNILTSCNIGISKINSSSKNSQHILTEVRKACAAAITKSDQQIHLYTPDITELKDQELSNYWSGEIDNAINQKRMFLVFQPIVSLSGDVNENFELFIRLRDQQGNVIFPQEFLKPVEASGHSIHVDRWIIAEAMRILAERVKAGHKNRFFIKLSSPSLKDKKLVSWITHNLERYELNAESVIFQVVAHQAAENLYNIQLLDKQLHQLGCKLSFERFGKEENAFSLLKHINVEFLKIDFELVQNISINIEKLTKLIKVCDQANKLNIKTIVPFVEEAGSLSLAWKSGTHYIQGDFLQKAGDSLDFDFDSFT